MSTIALTFDPEQFHASIELRILGMVRTLVGPDHDVYFTDADPGTLQRYVVVDGHRLTLEWSEGMPHAYRVDATNIRD